MELILENVRCFHSRQVVPIRPVTLLVGENSTGKTTFLAANRIAWDCLSIGRNFAADFNEEPFPLGTFEQIAYRQEEKKGRTKTFSIGFRFPISDETAQKVFNGSMSIDVIIEFAKGGVQPALASIKLALRELEVTLRYLDFKKAYSTRREQHPIDEKTAKSDSYSDILVSVLLPHQTTEKNSSSSRIDFQAGLKSKIPIPLALFLNDLLLIALSK